LNTIKQCMALLLALLLLPLSAPLPGKAAAQESTQTILVYIVGSDLESESGLATSDIREMLQAQPNPERLNVLVMTGGTTRWLAPTIPADSLSIYKIEGSSPTLLERLDSASMGEPETLLAFMDYAVAAYPASSYGLLFWDHGGGPMVGIGSDTRYRHDALTLEELQTAFSRGPFQGEQRLEWLAFDACLMASLEVAATLAPYTRYLIASEETLPGPGFEYGFLRDFGQSDLSGLAAGQAIIQATGAYYEDLAVRYPRRQDLVTLSLLDLDRVDSAITALDSLFADLSKGLQAQVYSDIARRRDGTKAYGRTGTTSEFDLIDLYDLASNLEGLYPERAGALKAAIGELVILNYANVPRSRGLSIYFPLLNKQMYEMVWAGMYEQLGHAPHYQAFVRDFGAILLSDSLGTWTGSEAPVLQYDSALDTFYLQLSPNQTAHYERAEYYILTRLRGEEYLLNYLSSDLTLDADHRLRANFDGRVMSFREPGGAPIHPFMAEKENLGGKALYQIPAVLTRREDNQLTFLHGQLLTEVDKAAGLATITGAIRDDTDQLLGKRDVNLADFDSVYLPYVSTYLTRDGKGAPKPLGDWVVSDAPRIAMFSGQDQLDLRYEPLMDQGQESFIQIAVTDTQGHVYASDLLPLNLPAAAEEAQDEPLVVDFPRDASPRQLFEEGSLGVTLMGFDFSAADPGDRVAPDTLHLLLLLENKQQKELRVDLSWLSVNDIIQDAAGEVILPPGKQAKLDIRIPIAPGQTGISLVDAGIRQVDSLAFQLKYQPANEVFALSSTTRAVKINTGIPVGAGYEPGRDIPGEAQLLAREQGISIYQAGEARVADGQFQLPLMLVNQSESFDQLRLAISAINNIWVPLHLPEPLPQGATRYATLSLPTQRTVLEEGMEEYQYLFDGLDNMEALGIAQAQQVWLQFEAFTAARGGRDASPLQPVLINLSAPGEAPEQPIDSTGEVVFSDLGLTLTRLDSDPTGRTFLLANHNDHALRLTSFGRTQVDGVDYAENVPLLQDVPPGQYAYTWLFGYLPGIFPEGEELTFTLNLLHLMDNRLLLQSEPITLPLVTNAP